MTLPSHNQDLISPDVSGVYYTVSAVDKVNVEQVSRGGAGLQ